MRFTPLLAALALAAALPALAHHGQRHAPPTVLAQHQVQPDPAAGEFLARQWCANCHQIGARAPGARNDAAPSFQSIAARPGVTAEGIATYIRVPHANMPDHGLTQRQAQDLAAYVMAQRSR